MFYHISFIIPNEYGNYLYEILKNTSLTSHFIIFNYIDVIFNDLKTNIDIQNGCFYNYLDTIDILKPEYYIVFLKATFFKERDCNSFDVSNLNEFLLSQCNSMLFITDSKYVNIITKDSNLVSQIKNNVMLNKFEDFETSEDKLLYNIFNFV